MSVHLLIITTLHKMAEALCWMLVHSIWQGLILAIAGIGVLMVTKKASPVVRYNLVSMLFWGFVIAAGITFFVEWQGVATDNFSIYRNNPYSLPPFLAGLQQLGSGFRSACSAYAPFIVFIWLIIVCWKALIMLRSLAYCNRIQQQSHSHPDDYWKKKITILSDKLHISKKVLLLESEITKVPIVLGHFKPVIFLPAGLMMNIPADQVEAVLLHELAHIRRNDYAVNLVQSVIEHLFFFNPALLWMGDILRQEREHCCDDIALAETGNKQQFIKALITFKEYALQSPGFAPAFAGRKNHLLHRVTRIVYNKNKGLTPVEKTFFCAGVIIITMLAFTVGHRASVISTQVTPVNNTTAAYFEKTNDVLPSSEETDTPPEKNDIQHLQKENVITENTPIAAHEVLLLSQQDEEQNITEKMPEEKDEAINADEMMAYNNKLQAEADQFQAIRDKEQAMLDYLQAEKDLSEAEADRLKADEERALADKQKAENQLLRKMQEADIYKQVQLKKEMEKQFYHSLQKRN